ncbi:MAG: ferrochelatase [Planctomycetes bacterium]|nr:ferrochelatase [Planctomycetota bacterium]
MGVLLVNLGTPDAPERAAVARYLREFLMDPRVIDMPWLGRALLVHGIIAPFRSGKSAEAYRTVFTDQGSPLLVHGEALRRAVEARLDGEPVVLGMRYGNPSLSQALESLRDCAVRDATVLPLFPQTCDATTGSVRAEVERLRAKICPDMTLKFVDGFSDHPAFIEAQADLAREAREGFDADHVLLSYHGLPERQLIKANASGSCLVKPTCCDRITKDNVGCYRAQCFATSRALARALELGADDCTVSFQSRLGRARWIHPYTDVVVRELAAQGRKRILVLSPAFVADCLETLEELGLRLAETFREAGGEELRLVPCVNASPLWVDGVVRLLDEAAH